MGQIGFRFLKRGDRESLSGRAEPPARKLGKDEPHPMTGLAAVAQLGKNLVVDRFLCVEEALQIVGVGHCYPEQILFRATSRAFAQGLADLPMVSEGIDDASQAPA